MTPENIKKLGLDLAALLYMINGNIIDQAVADDAIRHGRLAKAIFAEDNILGISLSELNGVCDRIHDFLCNTVLTKLATPEAWKDGFDWKMTIGQAKVIDVGFYHTFIFGREGTIYE